MSDAKELAHQRLEDLRISDAIDYGDYCAIFDALDEIETLAERDAVLEEMWAELDDVQFFDDEPTASDMLLVEAWRGFPAGTSREDIWRYFDERHSKGVAYLLNGCENDYVPASKRLYELSKMCFECESKACALNDDGICGFPLVHGKKPTITEDDGCIDGAFNVFG